MNLECVRSASDRAADAQSEIEELLNYRLRFDRQLEQVSSAQGETEAGGSFRAVVYRSRIDGHEALALVKGVPDPRKTALVWLQEGLPIRDHLGIGRSPEGFRHCMREIAAHGYGALVIIDNPASDMLSQALAGDGETRAMSFADCGLGARVLAELGFETVELLNAQEACLASRLASFGLTLKEASR